MSVFQRQMFANGDEVKFTGDRDDPILVRRPDGISYFTTPAIDRMLQSMQIDLFNTILLKDTLQQR